MPPPPPRAPLTVVLSVACVALCLGAGNTFLTRVLITALPCASSCAAAGAPAGSRVAFNKPVFSALVAFCAMASSALYYVARALMGARQARGGEELDDGDDGGIQLLAPPASAADTATTAAAAPPPTSARPLLTRYRPLALPALLDVAATVLQAAAALFIPGAVNAALRGSVLAFTAGANALLGVRDASAGAREWRALALCIAGVTIVGLSAVLGGGGAADAPASGGWPVLLGVALALASNVVQATQVALETRLLEGAVYEPVEANAAEGVLGALACLALLALAQAAPVGSDGSGHVEDSAQTACCLAATPAIAGAAAALFALFAGSTVAHLMLSQLRGSLFRAVVLTSRGVIVWGMEAAAFAASGGALGSGWQAWSPLELGGFALLVAGGVLQFRAQSEREAAEREDEAVGESTVKEGGSGAEG